MNPSIDDIVKQYHKGILSRYAKKMIKTNYYTKVIIEDVTLDPMSFRLCIGNGPSAMQWRDDELLPNIAKIKLERDIEMVCKVAWDSYLQEMATRKFP